MGRRKILPKPEPFLKFSENPSSLKPYFTLRRDATIRNDTFIISKYYSCNLQVCCQCKVKRVVRYQIRRDPIVDYLCHDNCLEDFKCDHLTYHLNWPQAISVVKPSAANAPFIKRHCCVCNCDIDKNYNFTWHSKDFCNELCLLEFQSEFGAFCLECGKIVPFKALGAYSVRVGGDLRQFCNAVCLKKHGKKFQKCKYCLRARLASENTFCNQQCQESYVTNSAKNPVQECKNCGKMCNYYIKFESLDFETSYYFCSQLCFSNFCDGYGIDARACGYCGKFVPFKQLNKFVIFVNSGLKFFCSKICRKLFIDMDKKLVPCKCCSVVKRKHEIIRNYQGSKVKTYCSLKCLSLDKKSLLYATCDQCQRVTYQKFTFPMADSSISKFCTLLCLVKFRYTTTSSQIVSLYLQKILDSHNKQNCVKKSKPKVVKKRAPRKQILRKNKAKKNKKPPGKSKEIKSAKIEIKSLKPTKSHSKPSFEYYLSESGIGITTFNYWLANEIVYDKKAIKMESSELCNALAQFVIEIERPDKNKFAPDTIYSLCLGIQRYLLNNGRDENIFFDSNFKKFRKCFDAVVTNEIPHGLGGIKIQEDLLWETKQLGDHNPDVLVNTLIYLFTKNLKFSTVDKHMGLSICEINYEFSHCPDNITITCRAQNGCKKRKQTYILRRDATNPMRCLVRLCQLYLSRCPSRVKSSERFFYLESQRMENGIWFNEKPLRHEAVEKSLNLMRIVKELSDIFE
ncbi:zinc finger MYM-type protein 4-like [Tribolium madens]|uniref:zinc finger MYM-type protein 4-like n=1 Tax=Tribolium madens TaxID=41895 RepID=UPI001CF75658|nr:zinc finger MYM-type protein 4-like [Tribolium madens]